MKKILFLIHALNPAGAQRILVELVNNMDFEKFDITVQTIYDTGELRYELDPRIHYKTIAKLKNNKSDILRKYLYRRILWPKYIYEKFISDTYDYEVAFLEGEPTKLIAVPSKTPVKKIAWVHTSLLHNFSSQKLYKSISDYKHAYEIFDKIICVSKSAENDFIKRFGFFNNINVKYNPLNDALIEEKSRKPIEEYTTPKQHFLNMVAVGNMRPEKRYDRLLKACKLLKNYTVNFCLTIIGNGSEFEFITELQKKLDVSDCVQILGEKSNPYPYMKNADILVSSSDVEGYSTVAVEACLLGTPVLATDNDGMKEVLNNGEWGILAPKSEEGLYKAMKKLIEDPSKLHMYKEKLKEYKNNFSFKKRIIEIEELFGE